MAKYGELAPLYDRIYSWKEYGTEARELLELATRLIGHHPRSLLDVGCGTGQHLAAFHRQIADVAGVDQSAPMLREARKRLGPGVSLTQGDMRRFALGRTFDVIVCLFSAIGYLSRRADRDRALRNFRRHLAPGGIALVEGWVIRSKWRPNGLHLLVYDGSDAKIARLTESSRRGRRSLLTMHYLIGQPKRGIRYVVEQHRNVLLEPRELLGSFRRAGLRARVRRGGRFRDRGLYIGVRPTRDDLAVSPHSQRRRPLRVPRRTSAGASRRRATSARKT